MDKCEGEKIMKIYYLMVKTHRTTGLKYLCQTTQDPVKYKGSGDRWKLHIKKHGYDVDTDIIQRCYSKESLKTWGLFYSNLWCVVDSNKWANIKPEDGTGGFTLRMIEKTWQTRRENGTDGWTADQGKKKKETLIKNGTDGAMMTVSSRKKANQTMNTLYGGWNTWTDESKIKAKETQRKNGTLLNALKACQTTEARAKAAKSLYKTYRITDPDGNCFTITGLKNFCQENNLSNSAMCTVAKGKLSHYKGWTCQKIKSSV